MRLHRLSVTAFGPFADTVEVDFDALSEAGLFLLTGPTGAGKSSILDAVCFALYGEVPGDRSTARRLRCDVAPPGRAPRVELVVTLAGRRFRLVRSPAWRRPKKRGVGETLEPARVTLLERVGGEEVHLTSRLDEAGQLVSELLGMTLTQFTQVALLPQGRFQDFLRARSEDRHALLQQLFRTRRFGAVERWLRERRVELRRASEGHAREVAGLLHRLGEAAGTPYDAGGAGDAGERGADDERTVATAADEGRLGDWGRSVRRAVRTGATAQQTRLATAETAAQTAATACDEGGERADRQRRHAAALVELARLDARSPAVERRRAAVEAARRALPVTTLAPRLASAAARLAAAPVSAGDLEAHTVAVSAAERALAEAEGLVPRDHERDGLGRRVATLAGRCAVLAERAEVRAHARAALPTAVASARERQSAAEAATARVIVEQQQVDVLVERLAAHERVTAVVADLAAAEARRAEVVDVHQHLREAWLGLRERRLTGMAAEIAQDLAVGASCPVCGSCDHPHPARTSASAVTAGAERAARQEVETAEVQRLACEEVITGLASRLAADRARAGDDDRATLVVGLAAARERLRSAATLADGLTAAAATVARLEQESVDADRAVAEAEAQLAAARADHRLAQELYAAADRDVRDRLGGHPDLPTLLAERRRAVAGARAERAAAEEHRAATDDLERLRAETAALAEQAGFVDVAAALAAGLAADELAAADREVHDHDVARRAAAGQALATDLVAAAALPAPDLAALTAVRDETAAVLRTAHTDARHAADRRRRVDELTAGLDAALRAWEPVRTAYAVAAELAAFAEGRAPDNRLQMRLSAYVLSWRLGQVVAAANVRLARMTDQRYALEHTAQRGAGESRGGLSLLVRDAWSGEARDPVTLSGGETFVVSLALALGLTDVVSGEAGGAEVGTLFVDEGFGSLDAETLDDVMDTLDDLRDGGRVVGVVSHVAEMRERIPVRLQVDKARQGSTVSLARDGAPAGGW